MVGEEEISGVGSGLVGKIVFDVIGVEFVGVGGSEDFVIGDFGGDDLGDDVVVGEVDNEFVFGGVVFVFGLGD